MLDSIYRNETDLYASFFTNTSVRAENFDFSDPLYEVSFVGGDLGSFVMEPYLVILTFLNSKKSEKF